MVISMFGCFGLPVGNRLLTMHQRARLLRFLLNEHMRCSVLVVLLETTALEARAVRSPRRTGGAAFLNPHAHTPTFAPSVEPHDLRVSSTPGGAYGHLELSKRHPKFKLVCAAALT